VGLKKAKTKHEELLGACDDVWRWLKNYPPYRAAYKQQKIPLAKKGRAIWGFEPVNPRRKSLPSSEKFSLVGLLGEMTGLFPGVDAFEFRSTPIKQSSFFPKRKEPVYDSLPRLTKVLGLQKKTFFVEVFPYKDPDKLADEFKEYVKQWQKKNGIKPSRFRVGNVANVYKAYVMIKLGQPRKRICETLIDDIMSRNPKGYNLNTSRTQTNDAIREANRIIKLSR